MPHSLLLTPAALEGLESPGQGPGPGEAGEVLPTHRPTEAVRELRVGRAGRVG